jgi:hypothetical protein
VIGKAGVRPRRAPPSVEACDLVSDLVLQTSFLTAKQFKARKSLEAYNQFVSGWVRDDQEWDLNNKVVTGRVSLPHLGLINASYIIMQV